VLVELSVMEQRYQAVLAVVQDAWKVTEVAARLGVSRQSVHCWIGRYERGGLAALADRSHRPSACPHQIPAEVEAVICELRREHPGWGPRRIEHQLAKRGLEPVPARSGIYRCLKRHGLIELRRRRKRREEFRRWERDRPMQLWQMDVMGGIRLAGGAEAKLVTGVDDHSRFCVAAGVVQKATAQAVCRVLVQALERHGVPEELLTDNGKVFTGRFSRPPGLVVFERLCRERGIIQRFTKVRSPTTTGKIERFHKTIQAELLAGRVFADLAQAQAAVDAWVAEYNTRRPHQALQMRPPAERFHRPPAPQPAPGAAPRPTGGGAADASVVGPAVQVCRRVQANGTIRLGARWLSVGRRLAGTEVEVRVSTSLLQVAQDGLLLKTMPIPPGLIPRGCWTPAQPILAHQGGSGRSR
jgi:transposase InsO family protein